MVNTNLFGPFVGDVNVAALIQGEYLGNGFVDGASGTGIVSVSVQAVPEPSSAIAVPVVLAMGFLRRRLR